MKNPAVFLFVFVAACLIVPVLAQLVIAYFPGIPPKGVFSENLTVRACFTFYSVKDKTLYEVADESKPSRVIVLGRVVPIRAEREVELSGNDGQEINPLDPTERNFRFHVVPVDGGNTFVAQEPYGGRKSVHVFYGQQLCSPPSNSSREMSVTLAPEQASVVYTTTFTLENAPHRDLVSLQTGELENTLFLKRMFYRTSAKGSFTGEEFSTLSAVPDVAADENGTTVTIRGTLTGPKDYVSENVSRILAVNADASVPTTVTLTLDRMALTSPPSPSPPPDSQSENRLQWIDPDGPIQAEYRRRADVRSELASLEGLWTEARAVLVESGDGLGLLFLPFVPAIPFLWALCLPKALPRHDWPKRRALLGLTLGMWLVPVLASILGPSLGLAEPAVERLGLQVVRFDELLANSGTLVWWTSSLSYCVLLPFAYRLGFRSDGTLHPTLCRGLPVGLVAVVCWIVLTLIEAYVRILLWPMAFLALGIWTWLVSELYRPGKRSLNWLLLLIPWAAILGGTLLSTLDGSQGWSVYIRSGLIVVAVLALCIWIAVLVRSEYPDQGQPENERDKARSSDETGGGAGGQGASTPLPLWIGLMVVLGGLSVPFVSTTPGLQAAVGWEPEHWMQFWVLLGALFLPYTVLAGLAPELKARQADRQLFAGAPISRSVGRLLFAAYVIGPLALGSVQQTAISLVPFVIAALWAYPYLVLRGPQAYDVLERQRSQVAFESRPTGIADLRQQQGEAALEAKKTRLPLGYVTRRAIFAFGPTQSPWENAVLSCRYGLILSTLLLLAYAPVILEQSDQLVSTPFPVLQVLGVLVLPFYARWLLAAFLLGYFYPHIRGANGLQKGLILALGIVVCTLPGNLLRLGSTTGAPMALLWDAGQTFLLLSVLGMWAFDLNTVRRHGAGWKALLAEYGLSSVAPYLCTLGTALGGVVVSIAKGKAAGILSTALELLTRGLPF